MTNWASAIAYGRGIKFSPLRGVDKQKNEEDISQPAAEQNASEQAVDEESGSIAHYLEEQSLTKIKRVTAEFYGLPYVEMWSHRHTANLVLPRQVAMYIAKTTTSHTLPEIARHFGDYHHTTILHAIKKITRLLDDGDATLRVEIEQICEILSPSHDPNQLALPFRDDAQ